MSVQLVNPREMHWTCWDTGGGFLPAYCHGGNIQPLCIYLEHLILLESSCWDKDKLASVHPLPQGGDWPVLIPVLQGEHVGDAQVCPHKLQSFSRWR